MGYEMYRLLTIKNLRKLQAKRGRKKADEVVDIEEEDRNKELLTGKLLTLSPHIDDFCRTVRVHVDLFGRPSHIHADDF